MKVIIIFILTTVYTANLSAQNRQYKSRIKTDTICGEFLYEYTIASKFLGGFDYMFRNSAFIKHFPSLGINNYRKGIYIFGNSNSYKIKYEKRTGNILNFDSSVNNLFDSTNSTITSDLNENIEIVRSGKLLYEKIHLNIEIVYVGRYLMYIPKFNAKNNASKMWVKKLCPVYYITKVFDQHW